VHEKKLANDSGMFQFHVKSNRTKKRVTTRGPIHKSISNSKGRNNSQQRSFGGAKRRKAPLLRVKNASNRGLDKTYTHHSVKGKEPGSRKEEKKLEVVE